MDNAFQARVEHYKGTTGFLKHFTTLSTGSILLIMSFSNKLLLPSSQSWIVIIAILGFVISILSSTFVYILTIFYASPVNYNTNTSDRFEMTASVSLIISWLSFLVGITLLSIGIFLSILIR